MRMDAASARQRDQSRRQSVTDSRVSPFKPNIATPRPISKAERREKPSEKQNQRNFIPIVISINTKAKPRWGKQQWGRSSDTAHALSNPCNDESYDEMNGRNHWRVACCTRMPRSEGHAHTQRRQPNPPVRQSVAARHESTRAHHTYTEQHTPHSHGHTVSYERWEKDCQETKHRSSADASGSATSSHARQRRQKYWSITFTTWSTDPFIPSGLPKPANACARAVKCWRLNDGCVWVIPQPKLRVNIGFATGGETTPRHH